MSNRPCNRCHMRRIVADSMAAGNQVVVVPGTGKLGGVDVYVISKGAKFPKRPTKEFKDSHFVAWFMELTEECAC